MATKIKKTVKADNLKLKVALKNTHKIPKPRTEYIKLCTDEQAAKEKLEVAATALRALADFLSGK